MGVASGWLLLAATAALPAAPSLMQVGPPDWDFNDVLLSWDYRTGHLGQDLRLEGFTISRELGGVKTVRTPAEGRVRLDQHRDMGPGDRTSRFWMEGPKNEAEAIPMFLTGRQVEGQPETAMFGGLMVVIDAFLGAEPPNRQAFVSLVGQASTTEFSLDNPIFPILQDPPVPANPEYRPIGRTHDAGGDFMVDIPGWMYTVPRRVFQREAIASFPRDFRTWPLLPGDLEHGGTGAFVLGVWRWRLHENSGGFTADALEDQVIRSDELRRWGSIIGRFFPDRPEDQQQEDVRGIEVPRRGLRRTDEVFPELQVYTDRLDFFFGGFEAFGTIDHAERVALLMKYTEERWGHRR